MSLLDEALRAGARPSPQQRGPARVAVLAGAGGALGSAVLEQLLAIGGFAHVRVLATGPVAAAMRGFEACTPAQLADGTLPPDTGLVVFDRERHANGREAAFLRPQPETLVALARSLQQAGVRRLVVVLPHAPALLPQALQRGLASLDEQALASLHFDHLVLVRPARSGGGDGAAARGLRRLAQMLLAQLHWLVPEQQQPVRAVKVAAFVAELARRLPGAAPGTRVAPAELLWQAAQAVDPGAVVEAWLRGAELPPARSAAGRWSARSGGGGAG
jgi:hypothetical protein